MHISQQTSSKKNITTSPSAMKLIGLGCIMGGGIVLGPGGIVLAEEGAVFQGGANVRLSCPVGECLGGGIVQVGKYG